MTVWVLCRRTVEDLDRLADFLLERMPDAAAETGELILGALDILTAHPEIGRPALDGLRELIISRGRTGYVALYAYDPLHDLAIVMRIRHQHEAGYAPG